MPGRSSPAALFVVVLALQISAPSPKFTDHELTALKACEGIVALFQQSAQSIWPGFDLSTRPLLVYVPDRWALLLNPPDNEDFGPLPREWPALRLRAAYRAGTYRTLAGQLAFDFDVGGTKLAALGLIEGQYADAASRTAAILGFVVHEAFHQYQSEAFGEVPWEREERYPILHVSNSALAALEMRILADGVAAALAGRRDQAQESAKMFVAVRAERWRSAPPFVARYEQGQEVREGTAAYVEKRSVDLARGMKDDSGLGGLTTRLSQDLGPWSAAELFRQDFAARTTDGVVAPGDMIRNRIYPVGSALGFLADLWGPEWKTELAAHVGTFSFGDYLQRRLALPADRLAALAEAARTRYDEAAIRKRAERLIAGYRSGFERDKADFEAQSGVRIEVGLRYRSISRSRSSQGRTWVVDDGSKTLQTRVRIYALKMDGFSLQVSETAIYEENDWDRRAKRVSFFVPAPPMLSVDGATLSLSDSAGPVSFREFALATPTASMTVKMPGTLTTERGRIVVDLHSPENAAIPSAEQPPDPDAWRAWPG
ncbi:MAG: hypothetical protein AB1806_04040 [Acidobacteriota bacterium]